MLENKMQHLNLTILYFNKENLKYYIKFILLIS